MVLGELIKEIGDSGILIVIGAMSVMQYYKSQESQRNLVEVMTNNLNEITKEMVKLEKHINGAVLSGTALEKYLIKCSSEFRWRVEKKTIDYLEKNHLNENWAIISTELTNYFKSKMNEFENEIKPLVDETTYKIVFELFESETLEALKIIVQILESLKDDPDGIERFTLGKRTIKAHMSGVQTRMISKIQETIN